MELRQFVPIKSSLGWENLMASNLPKVSSHIRFIGNQVAAVIASAFVESASFKYRRSQEQESHSYHW